jgi:drug/metabolite transporter (DMT)-like permease
VPQSLLEEPVTRRNLWAAWAVIVGAAFAVTAIAGAKGIVYVIVAIVAAAGYSAIHALTRRPAAGPQAGEGRGTG